MYRVSPGNDISPGKPGNDISPGKKAGRWARGARQARPSRTPEHAKPATGDLRERVIRHATLLGAIWAALLVVDLVTGAPFWAHWPGIAMTALVAMEATPLLVRGWFKLQYARGMVIVGALALINLFTWSGYPWALWPAGALIVIELNRQLWGRRS